MDKYIFEHQYKGNGQIQTQSNQTDHIDLNWLLIILGLFIFLTSKDK